MTLGAAPASQTAHEPGGTTEHTEQERAPQRPHRIADS